MRRTLARHWEVAAACLLALVAVAAIIAFRPHRAPVAAVVTYPQGGRCDQPNQFTRGPCQAVSALLTAANDGDSEPFCQHAVPRRLYRICVNQIAFSDAHSFSDFATYGHQELYAQRRTPTVARVRVRVQTTDDAGLTDVFVWVVRENHWWRVYALTCASCPKPTPAA